jgi:hypothetical protein
MTSIGDVFPRQHNAHVILWRWHRAQHPIHRVRNVTIEIRGVTGVWRIINGVPLNVFNPFSLLPTRLVQHDAHVRAFYDHTWLYADYSWIEQRILAHWKSNP